MKSIFAALVFLIGPNAFASGYCGEIAAVQQNAKVVFQLKVYASLFVIGQVNTYRIEPQTQSLAQNLFSLVGTSGCIDGKMVEDGDDLVILATGIGN